MFEISLSERPHNISPCCGNYLVELAHSCKKTFPDQNLITTLTPLNYRAVTARKVGSPGRTRTADKVVNSQIISGEFQFNNSLSFQGMADKFLANREGKIRSIGKYKVYISKYLTSLVGTKIDAISFEQLENLHSKIGKEHGYYMANRIMQFIRAVLNYAVRCDYLKRNVARDVKLYREPSRDRFASKEELPRLLRAISLEDEQYRAYFFTLLFTGARPHNVNSMQWEDIDFECQVWTIRKTKTDRTYHLPLTSILIDILQGMTRYSRYVFPSETSESGHIREPRKAWLRVLRNAGIEQFQMRDLRRTIATYQNISGVNITQIAASLGHSSPRVTGVYARNDISKLRENIQKASDIILDGFPIKSVGGG